jgi:hypothetical protein
VKIITVQPVAFTDNVWVTENGQLVEGQKSPYPYHVDAATGDVQDQDFWQGDPKRIVGFQSYADRQRVDLWWDDAAQRPGAMIGMFPVMVGPDGLYTYTLAVESFTVTEVSA